MRSSCMHDVSSSKRYRFVNLKCVDPSTMKNDQFQASCARSTARLIDAINEIFIDHMSLGGMSAAVIKACVKDFPGFDPDAIAAYIGSCGFVGHVRAPKVRLDPNMISTATCFNCATNLFAAPLHLAFRMLPTPRRVRIGASCKQHRDFRLLCGRCVAIKNCIMCRWRGCTGSLLPDRFLLRSASRGFARGTSRPRPMWRINSARTPIHPSAARRCGDMRCTCACCIVCHVCTGGDARICCSRRSASSGAVFSPCVTLLRLATHRPARSGGGGSGGV